MINDRMWQKIKVFHTKLRSFCETKIGIVTVCTVVVAIILLSAIITPTEEVNIEITASLEKDAIQVSLREARLYLSGLECKEHVLDIEKKSNSTIKVRVYFLHLASFHSESYVFTVLLQLKSSMVSRPFWKAIDVKVEKKVTYN